VSVVWVFEVGSGRLVDLLHDFYGMLLGCWKSIVFDRYYEFYVAHRGRRLSEGEVGELLGLKERFPWEFP